MNASGDSPHDAVKTSTRWMWRVVVFVLGATVVLTGVLALLLPWPAAIFIIPAGLGILATEFVWARALLNKARCQTRSWSNRIRRSRRRDE